MAVVVELARDLPAEVEAVVVPACSDQLGGGDTDWDYVRARGFEGKLDQVASVPATRAGRAVVLVGLGPSGSVGPDVLRRAAAVAGRSCVRHEVVATFLLDALPESTTPAERAAAAQALAEGTVLGAYRFTRYKADPGPDRLARMVVVGTGGAKVRHALERGARIADGVNLARDLVNEPGGSLTPRAFAEAAVEVAERENLQISVLDETDIAEAGLGGLLAVNRGSTEPPRFVELCYVPERPRGHLALVGKGITFDSGGLSLKTAAGMMTMKDDMAGAAAVLGAMSVLPAAGVRARVSAYLPLTDNMGGGDATRPGDVIRIRNGTTVEVLNTDAEGRLVLADALAMAVEAEPDAIVDLATLTGGVEAALGKRIAGVLGSHDDLLAQVRSAADGVGERLWPLPLPPDYRRSLDSDVADLRNIPKGPGASTIMAALFLREFTGGRPWAHLDIAGTAWSEEVVGEHPKGGTGYGVRLLVELARTFRRPR